MAADVVSLSDFRDRRKSKTESLSEIGVTFTKNSLHDHLRGMHGWGGAKSAHSKADLERIHDDLRRNPVPWEKPHRHV